MNTGAKEIQQVNPGGPDKQPKHQAPTISSIDKSLRRNTFRHLKKGIQDFHRRFVLAPADKAANNVVVV